MVVTGDPAANDQGDVPLVVHAPNLTAPAGITVEDWLMTFSAFPLFRTIEPVGLKGLALVLKKIVTPSPIRNELFPMSMSRSMTKIPGR